MEGEQKFKFDDDMFFILFTTFLGFGLFIWVYIFFRKRRVIQPTFPCHCIKCEERRKRGTLKKKRLTTSSIVQVCSL